MRFPADFLDEIRARLPISSVIGQRAQFDSKKSKAARGDFWACCPFHGEKTPSFHCEDRKGRYYCFGCGANGDIFRFLCDLDGISFVEAVERLAGQAGLPMPIMDPEQDKREKAKANLYEVMEMASRFFHQQLHKSAGALARSYLAGRDLSQDIITRFDLGYAPAQRMLFKDAFLARGIGLEQLIDCGLIAMGEDDRLLYERFHDRIMFPIHDLRGRVVAFGGRAMDKEARAKYLNSPETVLFEKGKMLYNAARARAASTTKQGKEGVPIVVVEGYMDVIALDKAGFHGGVAPLGTALTEEQLTLLWRLQSDPFLCFDGDKAGLQAAFRAAERALPLLKPGVSLRFVLLPSGQDPDDIIRHEGERAFGGYLQQAISLAELLWRRATQGKNFRTPEERARLEQDLKRSIFTIQDESLRHYYLQDMRERLRNLFRPAYSFKEPQNGRGQAYRSAQTTGGGATNLINSNLLRAGGGLPPREAAIILALINHPSLWYEDFETLERLEIKNSQLAHLHRLMVEVLGQWQPNDGEAMRALLEKKGGATLIKKIDDLVHKLGLRSVFAVAPIEDAREALKQAVHLHLRAHHLHNRLQDIERQLIENPDGEVFSLLREVKKELQQTDATEALIEGFGCWRADK
ncbi:DNA primase [Bartonella sp. DGB2]|uniref:DNA primase n=1 Tax=Bartonella sp. DGB2 TaxID=3388426 RepID=UPI00398FAACB